MVDVDVLDLQPPVGGVQQLVQGGALRTANGCHHARTAIEIFGGDRMAEATGSADEQDSVIR
jgi:hypothetical protein